MNLNQEVHFNKPWLFCRDEKNLSTKKWKGSLAKDYIYESQVVLEHSIMTPLKATKPSEKYLI